jgi:hypothetical protein
MRSLPGRVPGRGTRFVPDAPIAHKLFLTLALVFATAAATSLSTFAAQSKSVLRNASALPGGGWVCNDGFIKRSNSCVAIAQSTDNEIREHLVIRSIEGYAGSCPCPFNTDRAGRRCGARSAYSRPGGASPLCYASDVSQKMVDDYRKKFRRP